ncbi:MAG: lamin tail domain-containing protein [Xenococcaceae cyanobacterium MO_207.B15]|nr:lamin tail domain-containing protein [Xenococcaceae cyanobacterium MO_207.B15]
MNLTIITEPNFNLLSDNTLTTNSLPNGEQLTDNASFLVISEIMYNPASAEDDWEWIEVYNSGTTTIDLSGYVLDDGNNLFQTSSNIATGSIAPGETGILYNSDDVSASDFEAAWGTVINLIAVTNWNTLSLNNGGDTVSLWDSFDSYSGDELTSLNAIDTVAYDDSGEWVADNGLASIYLTDLTTDNNVGGNWALSTDGVVTPAGGAAYTSAANAGNSGSDIGSPGGTLEDGGGEPEIVPIYDIQGASQISPFVTVDFDNLPANTFTITGENVTTTGVVTAVDSNGFYLQDPTGDGNDATSDALFVFTGSSPNVSVGDSVTVEGTVAEFFLGGTSTRNLPTTQITNATVEVLATGIDLPAPIIIGNGARIPPSENIDDDAFGSFDPTTDGIDFFESTEGMRVTATDLVTVSGTTRFGEIFAVVDNGADATGISTRGTLNISPDDFNPEKIQIDADSGVFDFDIPQVNTGARLGDVTGVVSYNFGNFEIIPTEAFTVTNSSIEAETTTIEGAADKVTVASYNVLNLDPNEDDGDTDIANGRFNAIADDIINNLNTPDIIGLQEIQDSSGSVNDGVTDADATLQELVNAIAAAGGPTYEFIDNTFITDGLSGGQPGGNIRTAFLYNPERVSLVEDSVQTIGSQAPGEAFNGARLPLVATFEFNNEEVTVVNNHFSSKGGSAPILGIEQPFDQRQEDVTVNGSLDERKAQSEKVQGFVNDILTNDPNANVVVVGDFNEFEFVSPVQELEQNTPLTNLTNTLPENERYTFNFQGNSQSLDHILVSESLLEGSEFDIVHVNSEFADTPQRASDHDPLLASITISRPIISGDRRSNILVGSVKSEIFDGGRGRDIIITGGGEDTIVYNSIVDRGDIVTDFTVGQDVFDFSGILNSVGYTGSDPIADGYIGFRSLANSSIIKFDPDGNDGSSHSRSFILALGVTPTELNNLDNFEF